jgi:iron complex outermembrane recepter protein
MLFLQQSYIKIVFGLAMMGRKIGIGLISLLISVVAQAQWKGMVRDADTGDAVPFAIITLLQDSTQILCNELGRFESGKPGPNGMALISRLGYKEATVGWKQLPIDTVWYIHPVSTMLEGVLIAEDHAKNESFLPVVHLNESYFRQQTGGNLAELLDKQAGVSALTTGTGIAKPVIRGLHGNRIIINKDYIKQEGHQWGVDHGIEISSFDVERVEILKGPSSLLYGSDALGGVINILPDALPEPNTTSIDLRGIFKSNNGHTGGSIRVKSAQGPFFAQARYSLQHFGDFRVPASTFEYGGLELPLLGNRIKNTAGQEESLNTTVGWKTTKHITRLTYSHYRLRAGLFSGAVGTPRSYQLTDDGDPYNIGNPRQQVQHQRLVLNHIRYVKKGHWAFNTGLQDNRRAEYSNPEAHSALDGWTDRIAAIQFRLRSAQVDVHADLQQGSNQRMVIGYSGMWQNNQRDGFDFLFPDFTLWRTGLYGMYEWEIRKGQRFSGGIRYDLANTDIDGFSIRRRDRQGTVLIESAILPYRKVASNWAASLGYLREWNAIWSFNGHLGRSFRIPYPNELASDGRHHGFFRHEKGNPDLLTETGWQLDAGMKAKGKNWRAELSAYGNLFQNYIYLRPTPRFSRLPEGGLEFEYTQHDAVYAGFEFEYSWTFLPGWTWGQIVEYVHSYNLQTGLALPFTPPFQSLQELSYEINRKNWAAEFRLYHQFSGANGPGRVDRNERTTPAFHLMHADLRFSLPHWRGASLQLSARNLFDTPYLNHLSRYRIINLPEPGRNIIFSVFIPLHIQHHTETTS